MFNQMGRFKIDLHSLHLYIDVTDTLNPVVSSLLKGFYVHARYVKA